MSSFWSNRYPILLIVSLFSLHFFTAYPGSMTPDTLDQFQQSLNFNFISHHPPLMAMLWSILNYIYAGPQTILFIHLTLLWVGVGFLYFADSENKFRWLYFVIPFIPNILTQSSYIWKDIGFGFCYFFVISLCVYYLYRPSKSSLITFLGALAVLFYGMSIKFQAQYILPFMIFFMCKTILKKKFRFNIAGSIVISLALIGANTAIINKFTTNTQSWQLRQFFDIAAIVTKIDDDSSLPKYVWEYKNYNFNKLKKDFTHEWVDPLIFPEDCVYSSTLNQDDLDQLNFTYIKLLIHHPAIYLEHRLANFLYLLSKSAHPDQFAEGTEVKQIIKKNALSNSLINSFKRTYLVDSTNLESGEVITYHYFKKNYLKQIIKFTKYYPVILNSNFVSVIILSFCAIYLARKSNKKSYDTEVLGFFILISFAFSVTLFFTTMASDYRYFFFVRLISFFTIPIFLKLWCSKVQVK